MRMVHKKTLPLLNIMWGMCDTQKTLELFMETSIVQRTDPYNHY
jgi:hypothetical protein